MLMLTFGEPARATHKSMRRSYDFLRNKVTSENQ